MSNTLVGLAYININLRELMGPSGKLSHARQLQESSWALNFATGEISGPGRGM